VNALGDRLLVRLKKRIRLDALPRLARAALRRVTAAWAARRQRAQDAAALPALSDPALRDVGLCRSDIPAVLRGRFRRGDGMVQRPMHPAPREAG
jgi:uncharacterized protein YjiS (DUF1127 family)